MYIYNYIYIYIIMLYCILYKYQLDIPKKLLLSGSSNIDLVHKDGLWKVGLDAENQNRQVEVGTKHLRLCRCAMPAPHPLDPRSYRSYRSCTDLRDDVSRLRIKVLLRGSTWLPSHWDRTHRHRNELKKSEEIQSKITCFWMVLACFGIPPPRQLPHITSNL